jgi:prolyl 4-hydroxylase
MEIIYAFIIFIIGFCFLKYIRYKKLYSYNRPKDFKLFIEDPLYSTKIYEIDNFLTEDECNYIIKISSKNLSDSKVFKEKSEIDNSFRKSKSCTLYSFRYNIKWVKEKLYKHFPYVKNHSCEALQVGKYEKGGFFRGHFDACAYFNEDDCRKMDGYYGPRLMTCLIYLNDDYEGGQTYFPSIQKSIIPKKGKALIFFNTNKDGSVIKESMHEGKEITNGEKWIATLWVRHIKRFIEF